MSFHFSSHFFSPNLVYPQFIFFSLHSPHRNKANATYFSILLWPTISVSVSNCYLIYQPKIYQVKQKQTKTITIVSHDFPGLWRSFADLSLTWQFSSVFLYATTTSWPVGQGLCSRELVGSALLHMLPQPLIGHPSLFSWERKGPATPEVTWSLEIQSETKHTLSQTTIGQRKSQGQPMLKSQGK